MLDDKTKSILEKVRGLLAKGASTHSEAEAESCSRLAHQLLEKYNLSMTQLSLEDDDSTEVGKETVEVIWNGQWRTDIAKAAARYYYCSFFHDFWWDSKKGKQRPAFTFVGRAHNRAVAIEMVTYLWNTVTRLGNEYAKTLTPAQLGGKSLNTAKQEFWKGCGGRIAERLNTMAWEAEMAEEKAKAAQAKAGTGTAVVLYGTFHEENDAFMQTLGLKKFKRRFKQVDSEHSDAGREAGEGVGLGGQIGGGSKRRAIK